MVEIKRFGDRGILVNFEQRIDSGINEQVIKLSESLLEKYSSNILYTIPAYCSLTIQYDPKQLSFAQLSKCIEELLISRKAQSPSSLRRQIEIPVCYDPQFGLDLQDISRTKGLSIEALVSEHTRPTYRVYMLGFLPGFVYMGKLPSSLICQRRSDPRVRVPQQSVAIAGAQTGIYPSEAPGGWNILGRTPLPLLLPNQPDPFLFRAGDQVRFNAIDLVQYHKIEEQATASNYELKVSYV